MAHDGRRWASGERIVRLRRPTGGEIVGALARWATFGSILAMVGAVAFRFLVLPRASLARDTRDLSARRSAAIGMVAALVVVPGALARLVVQTAEMRFPDDPWLGIAGRLVGSTAWGTVWLCQVGAAVLAIPAFAIARRSARAWIAAAALSLFMTCTPTLSSHAMSAAASRWISVTADWLHVVGAGVWLGTLLSLFATTRRLAAGEEGATDLASLLAAFSPLALVGAGSVVTSGVVSALLHIEHVSDLTGSRYGRTLLIKLAAVAVVAFFGWLNWKRNTRAVSSHGPAGITRGMRAELITVAIVLLITALLVATPPPMEAMSMP